METATNSDATKEIGDGETVSGSIDDDIPETGKGFFGPVCGCIVLILASAVCSIAVLWGVFELFRAIGRWWFA